MRVSIYLHMALFYCKYRHLYYLFDQKTFKQNTQQNKNLFVYIYITE